MEDIATKILIIGGGPAGYVAAIRAGQLGLPVILVEKDQLGGTCLNIGCIPSKALIHAADAYYQALGRQQGSVFGLQTGDVTLDWAKTLKWKNAIVRRLTGGVEGLLRKQRVTVLKGTAEIQDGKTVLVHGKAGTTRIRTQHLVLATGSAPLQIPALPFGGNVISSTDALALTEIPKKLAVVGAGYIGVELSTAFAKLGSQVTLIEAADRILPLWDLELTAPVRKRLTALGVTVMTRSEARELSEDGRILQVHQHGSGAAVPVEADRFLVAVGRRPNIGGFGLERLDLAMNGAFIRIDKYCATSMLNVWAIGDITGEPMLAHRAMAQGTMLAEHLAGKKSAFEEPVIPSVCFTDPEVVCVGLMPDQAKREDYEIVTGIFPFTANGRAMTQQDESGFVRIIARADNHLVLGIQAVGHDVSELVNGFALAVEMGAVLEDVAQTIHAHPTRGEAFQEAAFTALGRNLHS
ncbi:dihydrolipoyl dehydrogenase [Pseudochrobactrum sp. HB0163]|uniref:dihydrolipoyl dehydrogenase n=1 Tax=Pseudochrobactrum sp. HB0163 TaxID=3450708 RepID=UPI003F6DD371